MRIGDCYIGTSGWQYRHWRGNFYLSDLPQKDWLRFYSERFNTVEVNSSFYRQTKASTFKKWKSEVPDGFTFSVKGNRFITHIKRLKDCNKPLEVFFENAKVLIDKSKTVGSKHVILWQLPPSLKKDVERLRKFIELLPKDFRHAFEFRHKSWDRESVCKALDSGKNEVSLVLQDWKDWPVYEENFGAFVYLRFHGRDQLYTSGYSDEELEKWSQKMQKWINEGFDVYSYFNNDALGYAVPNALKLKEMIQRD